MKKRKNYEQDLKGKEPYSINSCLSCPDASGFYFSGQEELKLESSPCCSFFTEGIILNENLFPFIPHWCPRYEREPWEDMGVSASLQDRWLEKKTLLRTLSQEAKMVLNVLFTLPEEFLQINKAFVRQLISAVLWGNRMPSSLPIKSSESVYNELRRLTLNIID